MVPKVEIVIENCTLAEGPHWDETTQSLYFVDILQKCVYRYIPAAGKTIKVDLGISTSIIIPVRGKINKFLVALETRALAVITWDGESGKISDMEKITEVENTPETMKNILNDGKCDSSGRLWVGTAGQFQEGNIEKEKGSFYSFQNKEFTKFIDKVTLSNGLAFNEELKTFYFIDSEKGTIDEYLFDIEKGTIADGKPIFTLSRNDIPGFGDGMAIDTDGNLWVAVFNGSRVIKINPQKPETLLYTLNLPAEQVTSVAFGGKNLDELYVTTGCFEYPGQKLPRPENGAVFKVTGLGVRGCPGASIVL